MDLSSITGGELKQNDKYGALCRFSAARFGAPDSHANRFVSRKLWKSTTRSNRLRRMSRTKPLISKRALTIGPSRSAIRSSATTSSISGHNSATDAQRWPVRNVRCASGKDFFNCDSAGSKRMMSPSRAKRMARIFTIYGRIRPLGCSAAVRPDIWTSQSR